MKRIRQIVNNFIGKKNGSCRDADGMIADKGRIDVLASEAESEAVSLSVLDRKNFDRIVSVSLSGGQKTGCLIVCDVDRCKEINDIYGRNTGDAVLQNVGDVLRGVFGDNICIGSPGGDVFTLWLPIVSQTNAEDMRRLIGIVNDRLLHPARELPPVSISAGAAFCRVGDDCKSIYNRANKMLYRVRGSGGCGCEMSL